MVEHLAEVAQVYPAAAARQRSKCPRFHGLVDALAAIFAARDFQIKRNRAPDDPTPRFDSFPADFPWLDYACGPWLAQPIGDPRSPLGLVYKATFRWRILT